MVNTFTLEKIKYLCNLTYNKYNTSIFYLSSEFKVIYSISQDTILNSTINSIPLLGELLSKYYTLNIPLLISIKYNLNFIIINLIENEYIGSIVIGPFITYPLSKDDISKISSSFNINENSITTYFNTLKCINKDDVLNWTSLLFYTLHNNPLFADNILNINDNLIDIHFEIKSTYRYLLSENRINTVSHHSNSLVTAIFNDIKTGNIDKLLVDLNSGYDGDSGVVVKNNEIRNKKNLLISLITICTQASIAGGVSSEDAFTLSDSFIQNIECINDITNLLNIEKKIPLTFARKVNDKLKLKYSKITFNCIELVLKYLYDNISLSKISNILNISPQHISSTFKREMKITLSEYILKSKIQEAKYLFLNTNYSVLEISTLLSFNDQSYFTKIFKRYAGITPKKYSLSYDK